MGELAVVAHFACGLAEDGRSGCQRRARADAALAREYHAGYLSAVRARVAASRGGAADEFGAVERSEGILFAIVRKVEGKGMAKLLKNMVARDGVEPPTPAFSGLRSTT